jgi:hypothetical protein
VEHALIFFQQVEVSIFPFQLQSGPDEGEARVNNIYLLSNLINTLLPQHSAKKTMLVSHPIFFHQASYS